MENMLNEKVCKVNSEITEASERLQNIIPVEGKQTQHSKTTWRVTVEQMYMDNPCMTGPVVQTSNHMYYKVHLLMKTNREELAKLKLLMHDNLSLIIHKR